MWYSDGFRHYRGEAGSRFGTQRKAQRKLTIDGFLAEVPDLSYAPPGEEAQENLLACGFYWDTLSKAGREGVKVPCTLLTETQGG